jgi:hypothetical protein
MRGALLRLAVPVMRLIIYQLFVRLYIAGSGSGIARRHSAYTYSGGAAMPKTYGYNPRAGRLYAQSFALHDNLPPSQQLFYYADGEDCTNFISQCVWASYGGWIPGFSENTIAKNAARIRGDIRQAKGVWYGSRSNIGSNRWCRVEEFFNYTADTHKALGPMAKKVAQGNWGSLDPTLIMAGDIVQLIVSTYTPGRFGHSLYVTSAGSSWDDTLICCHTDDRLNEPMGWFSQFPDIYTEMRVLRFTDALFGN